MGVVSMQDTTLGERLKQARHERGQTQHQAAREFDVNQSTIAKWERGDRPAPEKVLQIAGYIGLAREEAWRLYEAVVGERRWHATRPPSPSRSAIAQLDDAIQRLAQERPDAAELDAWRRQLDQLKRQAFIELLSGDGFDWDVVEDAWR